MCRWPCSPLGIPDSPSSPWKARRWWLPKHLGQPNWCSQWTRMEILRRWWCKVSLVQLHTLTTIKDHMISKVRCTSGASFQTSSISRHHAWVSSLAGFTNTDLKGASRDVRTIEFHIYQVQAILPGDESHSILICEERRREENTWR